MRANFLFIILLLLSFFDLFAADIVLNNFESGSPTVQTKYNSTYVATANPTISGINTTANCGRIGRTSSNWYEMIYFPVSFTVASGTTKYIHVMVKYNAQPDAILRVDATSAGGDGTTDIRAINKYTNYGQWQDLVFAVTGSKTVIQINFIADAGFENTPAGRILDNSSKFAYIDEVIVNDSNVPRASSTVDNGGESTGGGSVTADRNIVIDASIRYQTIQGFGASDAWNTDAVGDSWSTTVKNDIATKLFSKAVDASGNPLGIGLSRWRFNIGAGSSEQAASNITNTERRVECFLNSDGTYDWTKQSGQQWFLRQAKSFGVEQLVAFINSPPRFYTKNGNTNTGNTSTSQGTNLKADSYDKFVTFITTVLKHFNDAGTPFAQISPINEPQYAWDSGQEGCPWLNTEVKTLVDKLNVSLVNNGLSTKILLGEAAKYNYLYSTNSNSAKGDQYYNFFSPTQTTTYVGNNSLLLPGLCGHSYWTDTDDATILSTRQNLYNKSVEFGKEFYQTEYCMMTDYYGSDKNANSLFLGKMIYADLAIANACTWDYWTALERERWSQYNRFYLIRLQPNGGDYADLSAGGTISADKNLWTLGNYSLFIRPGYKRIDLTGASDLAGLMGSAYIAPDNSKIVVVYVNWGTSSLITAQNFKNIPDGYRIKSITPYVTDASNNLSVKTNIAEGETYTISPRSVTTMVIQLEKLTSVEFQNTDENKIKIYSLNHEIYVEGAVSSVEGYNMQGKAITKKT